MNELIVAHQIDQAVLQLYNLSLEDYQKNQKTYDRVVEILNEIRTRVMQNR